MARRGRNGQTTTTLYDGWNPIQLQQGATVLENRLTGLGLDETYGRTRGGVTESYLTDALGSTVELRDSAQSQTTQYTYEPYGGTTHSNTSTNVAKYTGREQDLADLLLSESVLQAVARAAVYLGGPDWVSGWE